jgi:hypothetical protein
MKHKHFRMIFLVLIFLTALITSGNADVNLYLCPPSTAYFSGLSTGDNFPIEIIAEADDPGVTLIAFTVTWAPESSVEFVRPVSENSSELAMTGFFPPSDSSRLSGIVPNWSTQEATGSPGATPEIAVFTAPALNCIGPDSLARITFRKLSASQPTFSLTNTAAAQYLSGSESVWVPVTYQGAYINIDIGAAQMSGSMLSQATAAAVTIGGNDYKADAAGDTWTLDVKTVMPRLSAQPITVKAMQDDNLLTSTTIMEIIRSPGWYESEANHSEHPADGNADGSTDISDLVILGLSYGTSAGGARYDFRCDYNADGAVNLTDLLILGLHYGG